MGKGKLRALLEVIKPKQTTLLMVTFFVSYFVGLGDLNTKFIYASISTFLAISGTTALNMWLDKDIDSLMERTKRRPLPSGILSEKECAIFGASTFSIGILISIFVNLYLPIVLFLGLFFDIVIYTILLKRRSPYSIILGGVAGSMPALAGWVSASETLLPGLILAGIVLLWIPSHIWYISMHYEEDYRIAGIPMYPLIVGMERASWAIVLAVSLMLILSTSLYLLLKMNVLYLILSTTTLALFLIKTIKFARKPDRKEAKRMYKLASMTLGLVFFSMILGVFL